jgi:iron complex outermembrane receptor protein
MKAKFQLAFLPAVCLCGPAMIFHAQSNPAAIRESPSATGSVSGVLKDPSGAVVPGAKVEIKNLAAQLSKSATTSPTGRWAFRGLPDGIYQATFIASGFDIAILSHLSVTAGVETTANVTLRIARVKTEVEVNAPEFQNAAATRRAPTAGDQARSRNTAEIVAAAPGVSLRENGQLASVPLLHGMGDERVKLSVDGMTVSSACPNHMNPPLSYTAPSRATEISVLAGVTPVSMGGDSLGGSIAVESSPPVFASAAQRLREDGSSTGFYRSNGQNYGGALNEWIANRNLGIGYSASWATGDDYTDGSGHKVTSTYAQSSDQTITLAAQRAGHLAVLQASLHHTPYEGFVNAQMDMVRNVAESLNLHYRGSYLRDLIDAHLFWQNTWHSMNIGKDKSNFPMPMWMPMNTHGRDLGYIVKLELPFTARQTLRAGNELHRFALDDRWPAVAGTAPYMGPNTFVSINGGHRLRLGTYAEILSKWNQQWTTLLGLRNDMVWTNAGQVQGYSDMYAADAVAFNALNHARTDANFDAAGTVRYAPNAASTYELGYARKNRSPNLYERYAWSTNMMASGMIGWFGDGNYYVGNVALKPETANTLSGTAYWHNSAHPTWELKLTPYLTYIQSYVDVSTIGTTTYGMSTFAQLQFVNNKARIYGADISASGDLWNGVAQGRGKLSLVAAWLHGERLGASTPLYQMMPLNARSAFDEECKGLTVGIGLQAVDRKSRVDPLRYEQITPGYTLVNMHASYRRKFLEAGASADNLFNRSYELPLGGVNFDDFMASMWMAQIKPLTGRGRSATFNLTARF